MKTLKNLFLLMIVVATIFTGCKPSGDEPTPSPSNTSGQAPVFNIPSGGFSFRIASDTTIDLTQFVTDPQNDGWNLVNGSLSADNGVVSFNSTTKELTYTSPTNTSLTSDVIRFTLEDTNGNTQSYNVTINLSNNTTTDELYGRDYTIFTYDGVTYTKLDISVALGFDVTVDNVNFDLIFYNKVDLNVGTITNIQRGGAEFDPNFTVQSLVGNKYKIVTSDSWGGGNDPNNYTFGASIKVGTNARIWSKADESDPQSTDLYYVHYTEIVNEIVFYDSDGTPVYSDFLKGNFNILLSNGKTVSGSFKIGI